MKFLSSPLPTWTRKDIHRDAYLIVVHRIQKPCYTQDIEDSWEEEVGEAEEEVWGIF